MKKKSIARKIPFVIAMVVLGVIVFSGVVMMLWNSILPAVLHIGAITLWQAAGLLLLCRLLFGGRGRHGMHGWKKRQMWTKWQQMSPEERAQFGNHGHCYVHVNYQKASGTQEPL